MSSSTRGYLKNVLTPPTGVTVRTPLRVLYPAKVLDRHGGGPTTYARAIRDGMRASGVETGDIPSMADLRRPSDVHHFCADTGPLVPTRGPSVLTVHGVPGRWTDVVRNRREEELWRFRVQRAIRSTRRVIVPSQAVAEDLCDTFGVPEDQVEVIYHGIDFTRYATSPDLSPHLRARLPERFVLHIGNLEPRKNLIELVHAFDRSPLREAGVKLVVAGRPGYNSGDTMAALDASENVVQLGFVSDGDKVALMRRCELFVMPSLYEGFGFPVLEALAAGAPVACSRRGALEELAGPAYELKALDRDDLAEGITAALQDDVWQRGIRDTGPAWAREFSWTESVQRHLEIYRELIA
jgi:glycosyltransferase involved in cell wall biosynthesis